MATSFETIYNRFFGKITDDMYLELTYEDTLRDVKQFLLDAIPFFEFPRFQLYNYDEELEQYNVDLTIEEIHILALLMKTAWLERQINSIENTRMKYSGSDFKMTSQANHLSKLLQLKSENVRESTHAQRLYKRRRNTSDGRIESNWSIFDKACLMKIKQLQILDLQFLQIMSVQKRSGFLLQTPPKRKILHRLHQIFLLIKMMMMN